MLSGLSVNTFDCMVVQAFMLSGQVICLSFDVNVAARMIRLEVLKKLLQLGLLLENQPL